jgi:hypothetical protein
MSSQLDPSQRSGWHVSGWRAMLLAPILFPMALLVALFPFKKTRDRSAADVACFLREFINGTGREWDWDDFESIPITNPLLNQIRREALAAGPPNADLIRLKELLARVEALAGVVRKS